jgi:hypothetical protein
MGYERFSGNLDGNDGWDLRDHVSRLAKQRGFDKRHEELATWPAAARHVYFLHLAESRLAGSGVLVFLEQQLYPDLRGTHDALVAAGAVRLQRLFEAGISATLDTNAEYNHYRRGLLKSDFRWLRAVQKSDPAAAEIDTHDEGGSYWLVTHELAPAIRRYISAHRSDLA